MSEADLRQLVDNLSEFVGEHFAKRGEVKQMWHMVTENGEHIAAPRPFGPKDFAATAMREVMKELRVVRYAMIDEMWLLTKKVNSKEEEQRIRALRDISDHPDRIEAVAFRGEDCECGELMAYRQIIRTGKPTLGPLVILVEPSGGYSSEGRMTGMLPARGNRQ